MRIVPTALFSNVASEYVELCVTGGRDPPVRIFARVRHRLADRLDGWRGGLSAFDPVTQIADLDEVAIGDNEAEMIVLPASEEPARYPGRLTPVRRLEMCHGIDTRSATSTSR